jgi:hypothetical protein
METFARPTPRPHEGLYPFTKVECVSCEYPNGCTSAFASSFGFLLETDQNRRRSLRSLSFSDSRCRLALLASFLEVGILGNPSFSHAQYAATQEVMPENLIRIVVTAQAQVQINRVQLALFLEGNSPIKVKNISVEAENPRAFIVMQFKEPFNTLYTEPDFERCFTRIRLEASARSRTCSKSIFKALGYKKARHSTFQGPFRQGSAFLLP